MVFLIDKSFFVIIFLYSTGFGLLAAQYVFADAFGITLTNFNGVPICSRLIPKTCELEKIVKIENINIYTQNVTSTQRSTVVNNPLTAAAGFAWEILLLITGTYVFNIMHLLGVPDLIIAGLVAVYFILMIRTGIGILRGI